MYIIILFEMPIFWENTIYIKDIHVDNMAWWLKSAGALTFEL